MVARKLLAGEFGAEPFPKLLMESAEGLFQQLWVELVVGGLPTQTMDDPFSALASYARAQPANLTAAQAQRL